MITKGNGISQVPDRGRELLCENVPMIAVTEHAKESPPPPQGGKNSGHFFPSLGADSLSDFSPLTHNRETIKLKMSSPPQPQGMSFGGTATKCSIT